jgi:aminoglycoside 6'-N-acetyltransferase
MFAFRPLTYADIPLIHRWFNEPHVQTFYSLRPWSEEEVLRKLQPVIEGEKSVFAYIVFEEGKPIGYIQYCRLADHPWPEQDIDEEILKKAAGLDIFLGEPDAIGKGKGAKIIRAFLEQILWPRFAYCFADPDVRNAASVKMFEKCGFQFHKVIRTEDALRRPVSLRLMKITIDFM